MTVTLSQCMSIYNAIVELQDESMNFSAAYALVSAKKAFQDQAEFYSDQERRIITEFAVPQSDGSKISSNGQFSIPNSVLSDFRKQRKELDEVEADILWEKKKLTGLSTIKPSSLEILMDVFDFE